MLNAAKIRTIFQTAKLFYRKSACWREKRYAPRSKRRHLMKNKRLKNFAERLIFSEISISFGEISIISESERTLTWIIPISLFFPLFSPILVILGFYVSLPSHVSTASGHIGHMGHFFSG